MTEPAAVLELRGVAVERAGRRVLDGVTLSVGPGEVVAVIGPNGAGKTTLLEAAIGAVPLVAGEVRVGGRPLRGLADRARHFAYLTAEAEPPAEVRVEALMAAACRREQPDPGFASDLEARLGLSRLRGAPTGALSRGERRRVLLFGALVSRRPFLLLDEPTGVFDPVQLLEIVEVFHERAAHGVGLMVTVHQMSDAEALASRLCILNRGQVVASGTLAALRRQAGVGPEARLQEVFLSLLRSSKHMDSDARP